MIEDQVEVSVVKLVVIICLYLDVMPLMWMLRFLPRVVYSGVMSSICTLRRAALVSNAWS